MSTKITVIALPRAFGDCSSLVVQPDITQFLKAHILFEVELSFLQFPLPCSYSS